MQKIWWLIFIFVCGLIGAAVFILVQAGFFVNTITISEQPSPLMFLIFEKNTSAGEPALRRVERTYQDLVARYNVRPFRGFILLSDQPTVDWAGCVLNAGDRRRIKNLDNLFNEKKLGPRSRVMAEFPFNNKLAISYGTRKVSPIFKQYLLDNNLPAGPIMEIYDSLHKKIIYVLLDNADEIGYLAGVKF